MIKFIRRWKFVFIIMGVVSFSLALLAALLAGGVSSGVIADRLDWKQVFFIHAAIFILFTSFLIGSGIWLSKRMIRNYVRSMELFLDQREEGAAADNGMHGGKFPVDPVNALFFIIEKYDQSYRQTVEDLREANGFLQSLIEHSSDAIYVMDLQGRIQQVNPAFEELYGFHEKDVSGIVCQPFVPERLQDEYQELIECVRNGQPVNGFETTRRTGSGDEIHVSLTLSPILRENGELAALAAISRNITERRETEELLRRSEKLAVVGQLAAGVAHEIRNPLTTLRGFVQLLQQRSASNPEHLELMLGELDRINLIVSEFIILSKPHLNQFAFRDLQGMLTDMTRIMEPQANMGSIQLEIRFDGELPRIRCEENQLKQVFLNIMKNGIEAMPDGGVLTIETLLLEPERILIRFKDHGEGIPEELLPRLGEPFLTNKENGTGLGLMVSQQIIANHKGQMVIRSELGKGTCVDIVLPVDFELLSLDEALGVVPKVTV